VITGLKEANKYGVMCVLQKTNQDKNQLSKLQSGELHLDSC